MMENEHDNHINGEATHRVQSIEDFSERLNQLNPDSKDFDIQEIYVLLDESSHQVLTLAPETIFLFFESYPELQLLGPFMDALDDQFPEYVDKLVQSVQRKPTTSTLLMVNRHLNDKLDNDVRQVLMDALQSATENPTTVSRLRDEAAHYWERNNFLSWQDLNLGKCNRDDSDQMLLTEATKKLEGRYVRLRGYVAPDNMIEIQTNRFGFVAANIWTENLDIESIPLHLFVAIELPKYLRVGESSFLKEIEGNLTIDIRRDYENKIISIFAVNAKCIRAIAIEEEDND